MSRHSSDLMRLYAPEECTGKDAYPPEWHDTIKHAVREQAGHRCVRCLHPYVKGAGAWSPCDDKCTHGGPVRVVDTDEGIVATCDDWDALNVANIHLVGHGPEARARRRVEAAWRILTVHHLDGNKGNCRWWNLAALCQRDHLYIQGRVQMDRVWPWEHSEWFKPYAAGFYAWRYLGEELSREQTMDRLDELLALEQMAGGIR